ncbi:MAG: PilW family protein [Prochlorococcaceae cyanobacterium]|jgi:prepilin-type N-terminal cleavage/methylation domain-containing protein
MFPQLATYSPQYRMARQSSTENILHAHHSDLSVVNGFSLVELMVASVIGGLMIAAAASVAVTHLRSSSNQLTIQQRRSDWGKLTYLIQTETGEGISVAAGVATTGCANNVSSLFTITVPIFDASSPGVAVPTRLIHYYQTGAGAAAQLWRCGPVILDGSATNTRAGQLSPSGSLVTSLLMEAVPVTATVPDASTLTITPTTVIAGSVEPFTVRTRVRLIQ